MVRQEGLKLRDFCRAVSDSFRDLDAILAAHNAHFDYYVLREAFRRRREQNDYRKCCTRVAITRYHLKKMRPPPG